ncbi:MAG: T9SS type A sorting domain-containing protein [Saprospiraceae bacterium]|nr:T9SS type A sorting domain-containing protein [Saprospiraceae bacterium]
MKHIYFFITILFFLTARVTTAQVTLVAPSKMVRSGDSVIVELRAKTRDTLSTLQFTVSWNPSVLNFGRVDTLGGFPPSAIPDEYGMSSAAQGKLTFVWISTSTNGLRIQDSLEVFKLVFKAIGANGTNSSIQFVGSPTQIKASNAQLISLMVTGQDGNIKIGTTATYENADLNQSLVVGQNRPNPFSHQTVIPFSTNTSEEITLTLFDMKGSQILQKKQFFEAGKHEWLLDTEGIISSGFFIYQLTTKSDFFSKTLIKK